VFDIGIRREDKNRWERRTPLTPLHVRELVRDHGRQVAIQPSPVRIYGDDAYRDAGAVVTDDLSACRVIFGVKEIPPERLLPGRPHLFFAHVIKGQPSNMAMLRRLLELRCTLIDYETIVGADGQRLIFFGRHAGYAGMIDGLWALGQRLLGQGIETAFAGVRPAHAYPSLAAAGAFLSGEVAGRIREVGVRPELHPLVFGFTGGGNVSQGAQRILDHLPVVEVSPEDLPGLAARRELSRHAVYKVVFRRRHRDRFERHLPHLSVLVNGIYWEPGQPRLVTREMLRGLFAAEPQPKLRVIADVTCDVRGSVEANVRATTPGDPVYVYDPETDRALPDVAGRGPVVLAVDNLPCELPREASERFGDSLQRFLPALVRCDWESEAGWRALPPELRGAVIAHRGRLTADYAYLRPHLERAG